MAELPRAQRWVALPVHLAEGKMATVPGQTRHRKVTDPARMQVADLPVPVPGLQVAGAVEDAPQGPQCTKTEGVRSQRDVL